jgi:hypothetical protein
MSFKYLRSLLVISILLTSCSATTTTLTKTPAATEKLELPTSYPEPGTSTVAPLPYPEPGADVLPTTSAYPEPGSPVTGAPVIPLSGYEPQPGDENLKRDQVFLEMATSEVVSNTSSPSQGTAILIGNLPDPCHRLRVVVTPADVQNVINLDVTSVVDPGVVCTTVLKPFTASIPLGSYSDGQYTVMVNSELLGEFGTGYGPQPGDAKLQRNDVSLDVINSRLWVVGNDPTQVYAMLNGTLSDPCHELRVVVVPVNEKNQINLEVYSVVDPSTACITVIEPFTATIPLGAFIDGDYTVFANGERIGFLSLGSGTAPAVQVTP